MEFPLSINSHFDFDLVIGFEIDVGLTVEDAIEEGEEAELIAEDVRIELHVIDNIIECILPRQLHRLILLNLIHNLHHHHQRPITRISIHPNLQL